MNSYCPKCGNKLSIELISNEEQYHDNSIAPFFSKISGERLYAEVGVCKTRNNFLGINYGSHYSNVFRIDVIR